MPSIRNVSKTIGLSILALAALAILILTGLGLSVEFPGDQKTPSGLQRYSSRYLTMRDGIEIAVDVWLPADLSSGQAVPALIRGTRYGRAYRILFPGRVLVALGKLRGDPNFRADIRVLNEEGYAVVKVDARGSGASYGVRPVPWSDDEVADYGEVAEWITRQPWSNGRIGAYGVSYDGNTAELIAVPVHPAVLAVAPQYSYFDLVQDLIRPGGVYDEWFMTRWSSATERMDNNATCTGSWLRCWYVRQITDGVQPVDGPQGLRKRAQVYAGRNNPTVGASLKGRQFRDDEYGETGLTIDSPSPFRRAAAIAASGVAINTWVGWFDSATVDGAIARFDTLPNPQLLVIGPYAHGGKHDSNPYVDTGAAVAPDMDGQTRQLAQFFDPLLKDGQPPESVGRTIRYFVLGENAWKTTDQWPPKDMGPMRWWFNANGSLDVSAPATDQASDDYAVDFTVSSGTRPRWHTIGGPDVIYDDRAAQDELLLTYTSGALDRDMEIAGSAIVTLHLATTHEDGAIHVYLEDVAPDGTVTYLTEGILRLSDRAISTAPYVVRTQYHSINRDDSRPMTPGKAEEIVIPLFNVAALIKQGHRIRIAVAGADSGTFERIPENGQPVITVFRDQSRPSHLDLPMRWH